jgi:hypothetical protein
MRPPAWVHQRVPSSATWIALPQSGGGGLGEIGVLRGLAQQLLDPLANLEAEHARQEATPRRLLAAWRRDHRHGALLVVDGAGQPGASAEQEAGHVLDEVVDEVLFQRADVAAVWADDPVVLGAREHGVELGEVLPAVLALGGLAHRQEPARFEQEVVEDHKVDRLVELEARDTG